MKHKSYWEKRFLLLEQAQTDKAASYYAELEKQFTIAAQQAEKELGHWYARFAKEEGVSYDDAKKRLNTRELEAFRVNVEEYIEKGETLNYSNQWAKELERASTKFHVTRLESLQVQMQQQVENVYGYELDTFDQFIADQYKTGYYKTMFEIQKGCEVGFDVMKLDENKIAKLIAKPWAKDGMNFSDRIWRDKAKLMAEMPEILTQATIRGDGYAKMSKLLAERFNVSKSQANNLVVTESGFFSSVSQRDCFSDLGVEKYEIVATLDSKTSPICREMNQRVFDLKDFEPGVTASPFHCRCRTHQAPSFSEDFGVPEMRAARDENGKTITIPANTTYKEWQKKFVK